MLAVSPCLVLGSHGLSHNEASQQQIIKTYVQYVFGQLARFRKNKRLQYLRNASHCASPPRHWAIP